MKKTTWLQHKRDELNYFQTLKFESRSHLSEIPVGPRKKLSAMVRAKQKQVAHFSESHFGPILNRSQIGDFQFRYGYQRINLTLQDGPASVPYAGLDLKSGRLYAKLDFTSCGQSALSVALFTAIKIFGTTKLNRKIYAPTGVYYETAEFFRSFDIGFTTAKNSKSAIAILDSSTMSEVPRLSPACRCVIIDTTCWSLKSDTVGKLVRSLMRKSVDVFLVRSHIKLDCLGTEWGRLGSHLYLTKKKADDEHTLAVRRAFIDFANPIGARSTIGQVYPFLLSRRFHNLNEAWVRRLKATNRAVASGFKLFWDGDQSKSKAIDRIEVFSHDLFFWVVMKDADILTNEAHAERLITMMTKRGLPATLIASYPWDFFGLTVFETRLTDAGLAGPANKKVGVIRISIPDLCESDRKLATELIQNWLTA